MAIAIGKWRTCDLKIAAILLCRGYQVMRYGREQARVYFEFADTPERSNDVLSFWNKELRVEPVAFLDSLNRARDMVTQAMKA